VDYVHWNPVKHVLVKKVAYWPFPSFNRYVQAEILPIDWIDNVEEESNDFGEKNPLGQSDNLIRLVFLFKWVMRSGFARKHSATESADRKGRRHLLV